MFQGSKVESGINGPYGHMDAKPEFENHSIALTEEGRRVIILRYEEAENLYVVIDDDEFEPAYKVSPDKLRKIEEENPERVPSAEEIGALFEKLAGGAGYEELRKLEDETGPYLWEIKIAQEHGSIEYAYVRKGDHKTGEKMISSIAETAVHSTYFDYNGVPVSEHLAFRFVDGGWVEVS